MSAALNLNEPSTSLAVIPASALPTILQADKDDLLGKLAARVAAFRPDVSTHAGREEMRSLAAEVARTKAALDRLGKAQTEAWRKSTQAVNAERNILTERLDALRDQVRAPLTAWENAEKERVEGHEAALREITQHGQNAQMHWREVDQVKLTECLDRLAELAPRDWREFSDRASIALATATDQVRDAIVKREHADAEAAELARLRAENEARQRAEQARIEAERQAAITAAAVEAERKRQEAAAEAARIKAEQEVAAAIARAEQQLREAEEAAGRERLALEARERQAIADREAAERRAQGAEEASRRAAEDARLREEQARLDAEARRVREAAEAERRRADAEIAAAAAERRRIEAKQAELAAAEKRRAEDKAHRSKLNNEALTVLVEKVGLSASLGKAVIAAIAKGEVPHISIRY